MGAAAARAATSRWAPSTHIAQVVEHPQVKARGSLVEMDHPTRGHGARWSARRCGSRRRRARCARPRPLLGEHTDAVLRDLLGLDAGEIDTLRAGGVIGPKQ